MTKIKMKQIGTENPKIYFNGNFFRQANWRFNDMRQYILSLTCLLFASVASVAQNKNVPSIKIAEMGSAKCVIAVAEKPNQFEQKALDDLKRYLEQVTEAKFSVLPEAQVGNRPAIYLGHSKYAKKNGIDFSKLGKEEWIIKTKGNNLIITGGRPIGTFYGVWSLLEKVGVWALSMDETVVPSCPFLVLVNVDEKKQPHFAGRLIYDKFPVQGAMTGIPAKKKKEYDMWLLRSRINGAQNNIWLPRYVGDMFNISHNPKYHTLSLYVNPDKYFKTHPEYFSMDDRGERFRPRGKLAGGSICMSNPEVQQRTLENLKKMIVADRKRLPKDKWPVIYDISILDLTPFICKCPECLKISNEEESEAGLLLTYINNIANQIAKKYPEVCIRTFVYGPVKQPPKKIKPAKNVIIQICDLFVTGDYFRPLDSKFNDSVRKYFESWHRIGARLAIWDYWNMSMYFNPPRLETIIDTIQPDLQYFSKLGAESIFIEAEKHFFIPQNFMNLNYFVASRLMLDPYQDANRLIDIFLEGYYGKAAPVMKKYLNQLRQGVKTHSKLQSGMRVAAWDFMTPQFILNSYKKLKKVAEKLPPKSRYQRRVHDEMIPLLWLVIEKKERYYPIFQKTGISLSLLKKECHKFCMEYMKRFGSTKLDVDSPYVKSRKVFNNEFSRITGASLPRPEKFKDIPDVDIRVLGKYHFFPKPNYHTLVVKDPDSPAKVALRGASPDPKKHGAKTLYRHPSGKFQFRATQFGCADKKIIIEEVPQDEKYHWYEIPDVTISEKSWFWGHLWYLAIPLASIYQVDNGMSDANHWNCWFSAKFTGPAYVVGSEKENAIWVDIVVLVRPKKK